ncbi:putative ABC transport system permease protein [Azorhizobium sp. AG788]|uniref:ABC transporter permease n=1 Tax=Azorhizobium sp. AG788 TaxID=2183897 RepID=UPI00105CE76B|nr:ABC transporter permease [Azorhizobium sp. AG788]TDT93440.1 putative ABC transport system permease protein [Azorhizobium sp. AG788]
MFRFIAADLRRQWIGVLAVTLIIALAVALGVVVTLQERALRLGSARAAQAFDLVVGAPGSETQLVLSAVFLQPAPLPLMGGEVLAGLVADPRVAWAAPVGFGDFVDDYPIVGTTQPLVDGLTKVTEGRSFARLDEAVVGAAVPKALGAAFHPMHGQVGGPAEVHGRITYRVVGRLAPTGTPWDRAVLVPIEAVWRVHRAEAATGHHDHDAPETGRPRSLSDAHQAHRDMAPDLDDAINPDAVAAPGAPGLPAIVVKPKTIADAYKLRRDYRSDHSLAVFPGEVLTRLYATLGDARQVIALVAIGAQALVGAAILLVVVIHVLQRRKQIGALRAFGAPRIAVFGIVWLEVLALLATGLVAGFAIGYAAARLISRTLEQASGIALPVAFLPGDGTALALLFAVGGLVALIPALLAYRQSPAQALRG